MYKTKRKTATVLDLKAENMVKLKYAFWMTPGCMVVISCKRDKTSER